MTLWIHRNKKIFKNTFEGNFKKHFLFIFHVGHVYIFLVALVKALSFSLHLIVDKYSCEAQLESVLTWVIDIDYWYQPRMDCDEKRSSSPIPVRVKLPQKRSSSPILRVRLPHQFSISSERSSASNQSRGGSRMETIRGVIRNTFRRKKSRETTLILKRNEFLQYSTRHIRELETVLDYFRKGFKKEANCQSGCLWP